MAKQSFGLFDPSPQTSSSQSNQDKPIVLDPTELYDIPLDYIPITTDVEWIEFFGVSSSPCWVKGERLCKWAEAWLRAWNKMDANIEIKQDPSLKLAALFAPLPLPQEWTDKKQLLNLATRLDSYPQDNPIAYLLADITDSDRQIWQTKEPSIQHLSAWLAIQVPLECKPLEQVWQHQFQDGDLAIYYQTQDKLLLLRRWLGIAKPILTDLGEYELPVPDFLTEEFDRFWSEQIYRSEGKVLDKVMPYKVAGGGLFPEEVVLGVSVLRKSVQRLPVIIVCHGEGKPGKSAELEVTIDNSNSVPLTDLYLYIKELPSFDSRKPLEQIIPANQTVTFNVTIPEVPELPITYAGDRLSLSGELTFRIADSVVCTPIASDSTIIINQIFSSGFDIDEFM